MTNDARFLIIIGPTAVGKSSILDRLLADFAGRLVDLITYTTRPMRAGEAEGQPYHFVTEERFRELIARKFFIEWAHVHGRLYGTPRDQVEEASRAGKMAIADIDVQGAKSIRKEFPRTVTLFLMPPSVDALRQRFIKRGVTSEADLAKRLESAQLEMAQAQDFDHVVVNDQFDTAYAEIRKIVENVLKNQ